MNLCYIVFIVAKLSTKEYLGYSVFIQLYYRLKKLTTAVLEFYASCNNGDTIEGPPETPHTTRHYGTEGIKG